jgi:hypothetical protein
MNLLKSVFWEATNPVTDTKIIDFCDQYKTYTMKLNSKLLTKDKYIFKVDRLYLEPGLRKSENVTTLVIEQMIPPPERPVKRGMQISFKMSF